MNDTVAAYVLSSSPVDDHGQFVSRTYRDIVGRWPSAEESLAAEAWLNSGQGTRGEVAVVLMDDNNGYERAHAPIGRLYRAFFLRDSDQAGHEYWVDQFDAGTSIPWIAEYFSISEEFTLRYGDLDDREFVALVYRNVMGREPDQGGYDYWLDQMGKGMTRGELMTYFSDSPEYRNYANDRVFIVYATRLLERTILPTDARLAELREAFGRGGREAVVEAILEGEVYYDRFWYPHKPVASR